MELLKERYSCLLMIAELLCNCLVLAPCIKGLSPSVYQRFKPQCFDLIWQDIYVYLLIILQIQSQLPRDLGMTKQTLEQWLKILTENMVSICSDGLFSLLL